MKNQNEYKNQDDKQIQSSQRQLRDHIKRKSRIKNRILCFSLIIAQIIIAVNQALFIDISLFIDQDSQISQLQIIKPIILSLASTLGLGLLFTYNKQLIFTGLGYCFFITAYQIQYYPLINGMFTEAKYYNPITQSESNKKILTLSNQLSTFYGNSITNCFKAAMAISVAISCALGRVTLFETWICLIIGTFGYELNRRISIVNVLGDDSLGSLDIFAFGGFMGLAKSLILRRREHGIRSTLTSPLYDSLDFNVTFALLGSAILMIALPMFALDYHKDDNNIYLSYTPTLSLILSSAEGLMGSIIISLITQQQLLIRNFIHGPIAGIIFSGISSYFTTNLAVALTVGLIGGVIQSSVQNTLQRKFSNEHRPISTISFTLFGIQGFLASIVGCIAKAIVEGTSQEGLYFYSMNYKTYKIFLRGLISCSLGFGFGLVIGIVCYMAHTHCDHKYFNDFYQWQNDPTLINQIYQQNKMPDQNPQISQGQFKIDFELEIPF